ncbi:phosphoenolpyruvate carboxykinase (GTP) [Rothia kristinae]|uniref:Phosphoenolpyruvate carboxykinase [GTP] n=1 Tax=Rothia kristinae TaxID=37923 RepID=A0A199NSQ9_9MICC|nr:phosphoenolpyruvate carboxykinase (GTP) [Rothia kristinae]TDP51448.1 phosphoenolpyruvate carboxykinase (GTP) [Kocuria sp. AG109]MED6046832.1 phosphoenolpyruvate carboxykinase (GTP) [Rothia kristinae]OAX51845.1 phosphoenolpyruvate carboxykinase [Rothia kristinae]QPT52877.1 phosphoenolpyruvate carboxykinase (GTP) [Rothia kristinae]SQC38017.1 Phosphoenolpyruvate carboxykinase [GTP] [Rothia kristinae]
MTDNVVGTSGLEPAVREALENAPTTHRHLLEWVREVAELTQPRQLHWVDGSRQEWDRLTTELVDAGTFVRLAEEKFPNSFAAFSDPEDVARVEERTYICTETEEGAGPTNNWMDPQQMRGILTEKFRGAMRGRTMYVIPFVMGHLDAAEPRYGVEITDSAYVVCSMRIMATIGSEVLEKMTRQDAFFVECLHSVGAPLADGEQDVPWPCNPEKYIVQFPEKRAIWSFGSGYGGNALLGKKCYALRIASAIAHDEAWLAEHMLILKVTDPQGEVHYISGAFPSACGKTNFAMIHPTVEGWSAEMVGDDISWITFDAEGRPRVINPEAGLFGVAPGTGWSTNPNAMRAVAAGNTIFTNVALTDDGGVWWEGMTDEVPEHLTDWTGQDWTPDSGRPAAHPNSRFCTPIDQVDMLAPEYHDPEGVPLSAIIFGGRRKTTVPLVSESFDWEHGVFQGATLSSETTAAAKGQVGVVRRDPMAMLPFIGYNAGDYLRHWLDIAQQHGEQNMPRIFYVNWFRRTPDGGFAWPGFGENSRVIQWIVQRLNGTGGGQETPVGVVPTPEDLDLDGLDADPEDVAAALRVDAEEWRKELPGIDEWLEKLGDHVPPQIREQREALARRLGA